MKKIAITGATSGIGAEIKRQLDLNDLSTKNFSRTNGFDLNKSENIERIVSEIKIGNYDTLFLNSGLLSKDWIGSIDNDDIDKLFSLNTISNIKIINSLFNEIQSGKLKVVVTLSTASYINGIEESVYNSSKKALKEFIIAANTELRSSGFKSFIFMFVPHYISGTGMTSGKLDKKELESMVWNLISSIENNDTEFIPKYDEIYKRVFEAYKKDPIAQGLQSLEYRRRRDEK